MKRNDPWSMVRYTLAFLTWGVVTWDYFFFSHKVHHSHHFGQPHGESNHTSSNSNNPHPSEDDHDHEHTHGRGAFEFDLKWDGPFLYGLSLPLVLLTLASLVWNENSHTISATKKMFLPSFLASRNSSGDVNVRKWTILWFLLPLLLVMLDAAWGHSMSQSQGRQMGWDLYVRICMSLMSPSGYAATWALALFLIPVTKHSPILDWMRVTPVQALAFHRIAGWTSFWNSLLHGYLHLRHLMDVLNPGHSRPWYKQLKILLIPNSWECIGTQNPFGVFVGSQDALRNTEEGNQCWLALVNATGMISVVAFALLAITSLPRVRRYSYTLFYIFHIPMAWIMLFMAIWHYPTCALLLIPNIIYYISFNVPVYVQQAMDSWKMRWNSINTDDKKRCSTLLTANLIEGGSIELIFISIPSERYHHENRFVKIYHPSVSCLSHPFSVFSHEGLMNSVKANDSEFSTLSILLRPSGPFTNKLSKLLFENTANCEPSPEDTAESPNPSVERLSDPMIQFDYFYAGSFDWVDSAMLCHDEILIVAGGVGIVPFLEFLPSLQQRIQADYAATATRAVDICEINGISSVDTEFLLEPSSTCGPARIQLHWYCRDAGLASYVWHTYLCGHVQQAWENSPVCRGRLKIHLHLTSVKGEEAVGIENLTTISNSGLVRKHIYSTISQGSTIHPVQNAIFSQSLVVTLLLPGSIMAIGTILHWWWYDKVILADKYRDDNLIIRGHSIIFTLLLAMVVSIVVEHYQRYQENKMQKERNDKQVIVRGDSDVDASDVQICSSLGSGVDNKGQDKLGSPLLESSDTAFPVVTGGRPPMDNVIEDITKAHRPGVYMCGPCSLMESVEQSVRGKRVDCAFYREDSEM